ncbi:MAG: HAD family hydrolase [Desulfobacterota bacterium]|nr:HAD family hydrolase [Thermodesulfobacteriota bacterium]
MRYRLCIFDLDGTLIDSRHAIGAALQETARELKLDEVEVSQFALYIGLPLDSILQKLGFRDIEQARAVYRKHYYRFIHTEKPFPGIPELLTRLHGKVSLAIATNKSLKGTERTLRHTGLFPFFDVLETIDQGIPKPHRYTFDRICEFYRQRGSIFLPHHCLMVGDSPIDMAFADNAGIHAAFVRWGFHTEACLPIKPLYAVSTPDELYSILCE